MVNIAQMPKLGTRPLTNVQFKPADNNCRVWEQD